MLATSVVQFELLMMMTVIMMMMMTTVVVVVVVVALSYCWQSSVFSLDTATTSRKLVAHAASVGPFIMCDSDTDLAQEQRKS